MLCLLLFLPSPLYSQVFLLSFVVMEEGNADAVINAPVAQNLRTLSKSWKKIQVEAKVTPIEIPIEGGHHHHHHHKRMTSVKEVVENVRGYWSRSPAKPKKVASISLKGFPRSVQELLEPFDLDRSGDVSATELEKAAKLYKASLDSASKMKRLACIASGFAIGLLAVLLGLVFLVVVLTKDVKIAGNSMTDVNGVELHVSATEQLAPACILSNASDDDLHTVRSLVLTGPGGAAKLDVTAWSRLAGPPGSPPAVYWHTAAGLVAMDASGGLELLSDAETANVTAAVFASLSLSLAEYRNATNVSSLPTNGDFVWLD